TRAIGSRRDIDSIIALVQSMLTMVATPKSAFIPPSYPIRLAKRRAATTAERPLNRLMARQHSVREACLFDAAIWLCDNAPRCRILGSIGSSGLILNSWRCLMKKSVRALICGLAALCPAMAWAVTPSLITYVDATTSNTTLADGSVWTPTTLRSGTDGLWCLRNFANPIGAGTIYETNADLTTPDVAGNSEDAQRLKTTVSGLAPNTYNVYVYLWSDFSNWRLRAALTDNPTGELPLFVVGGVLAGSPLPTAASAADFDGS